MKKIVDKKWIIEKHRNDDCRAAVSFITKHSFIWSKCLMPNDYRWWHDTLKSWFQSDNNDNRKAGFAALLMFYKEVSTILEAKQDEVYTKIFKVKVILQYADGFHVNSFINQLILL